MGTIQDNDAKLNAALGNGTLFDVFADVYHPDVVMIEGNGDRTSGLQANLEREHQFFGAIQEVKHAELKDVVVDEANGVSFNTQIMHVVFKDGNEMNMEEVARRRWKDGKIVEERFFYNA